MFSVGWVGYSIWGLIWVLFFGGKFEMVGLCCFVLCVGLFCFLVGVGRGVGLGV